TGVPAWVAARAPRPKAPPRRWSTWEEQFLRDNMGHLPYAEIARALGRTENALKIRRIRKGMPPPTRTLLTATRVARTVFGKDPSTIAFWIEKGRLPARRMALRDRCVYLMTRSDLLAFMRNPQNWPLYNPETMPEGPWQATAARIRGDVRFLTTGEVARKYGMTATNVAKYIRQGRLPATRWANWHVREEDAERVFGGMRFIRRGRYRRRWHPTPRALGFLALAHSVGLTWGAIARMMKRRDAASALPYWLGKLRGTGQLRELLASEPVVFNDDGEPWGDWRALGSRFPLLRKAMERFVAEERLTKAQRRLVAGYLWRVAEYHELPVARMLKVQRNVSEAGLRDVWEGMEAETQSIAGDESLPFAARFTRAVYPEA
ncbi:MAG TPA: hypothetical protein VM221_08430, partial [Armatimonadota bacterium]|nr:hypothetical protein [Armatimonadota bacterium]